MPPDLPKARLREWPRRMRSIRRFEERLAPVTKAGRGVGHFHLPVGQETTGADGETAPIPFSPALGAAIEPTQDTIEAAARALLA